MAAVPVMPRELVVPPEEILNRHGGDRLVLFPDFHAFFGLYRLVQSLGVPPPFQHPARKLVHDKDLPVAHDVLVVFQEERLGPERLVQVVYQVPVYVVVEVVHAEGFFDLLDAALRRGDLLFLLVHLIVFAVFEAGNYRGEAVVNVRRALRHARDDQGRPGLVDEYGVDLVDDGVIEIPLNELLDGGGEIIPQIVEAELGVGTVGYVGAISDLPLVEAHPILNDAQFETQELVNRPHPVRIATGQVVVDGNHVGAFAGEGVQVNRHRGRERLTFTGLHLGDVAAVQHDAAHHLYVERPHPEGPFRDLPDDGESFVHDVFEGFSVLQALPKLGGHRLKLFVRQVLDLGFQGCNGLYLPPEIFDLPALADLQYSRQ